MCAVASFKQTTKPVAWSTSGPGPDKRPILEQYNDNYNYLFIAPPRFGTPERFATTTTTATGRSTVFPSPAATPTASRLHLYGDRTCKWAYRCNHTDIIKLYRRQSPGTCVHKQRERMWPCGRETGMQNRSALQQPPSRPDVLHAWWHGDIINPVCVCNAAVTCNDSNFPKTYDKKKRPLNANTFATPALAFHRPSQG